MCSDEMPSCCPDDGGVEMEMNMKMVTATYVDGEEPIRTRTADRQAGANWCTGSGHGHGLGGSSPAIRRT